MSNFVEIRDKDNALLGQLPVSKEGGRLRNIVYMTESGTYEKPDWLKFVIVKGVGGGGGGAGCPLTAAGQHSIGGHGAGSGYFEKLLPASVLDVSETVTIGAGGSGGAAGQNAGGAGGTTSFGSHCSATGGGGGASNAAAANTGTVVAVSGNGGVATGGDINLQGMTPARCTIGAGGLGLYALSGAAPILGNSKANTSASWDGFAGQSYGSGGNGGQNLGASQTAKAGGNGSPGIVIIEEYE